jgi:hypothetical protein
LKTIDGKTLIWGKKYSTTTEWGPSSGLSFLKFIPDHPIFASKLLILQSVAEIHNAWRHNRDGDYSECLEEIKKSIKDTYDYFDVVDSIWWESFFNSQNDIISSSTNEDKMLRTPFHWPQNMPNESKETNIVEVQESQGAIENTQVDEREMYIGSGMSHAQCESMEDLYRGLVQDIKEGSMIVVLATEDPHGYPLWIGKVIKIEKENTDVVAIEVHWYATSTHPFNGVYKPNMVVEKQVYRKRKRKGQNTTHHRTDLLKLNDVDILVYDFDLTKRGTLHSKTTEIIKRFLQQEINARWESVEPSRRSKRNLTSEMLGMHVDSDGAFINNREEYGSSTSSSKHSSEDNVDSDGISETISQTE